MDVPERCIPITATTPRHLPGVASALFTEKGNAVHHSTDHSIQQYRYHTHSQPLLCHVESPCLQHKEGFLCFRGTSALSFKAQFASSRGNEVVFITRGCEIFPSKQSGALLRAAAPLNGGKIDSGLWPTGGNFRGFHGFPLICIALQARGAHFFNKK